jgi:thymidine phosphorylase
VAEVFLPQEVIRAKRDGQTLPAATIEQFVAGITDGTIGDSQVGAFAMAVFFRGMTVDERVALTSAMAHSGTMLTWDAAALPGPVLDKHSTGGVGDKVSLMLAPLVACCGGVVPMISGRGLGHTGGTFDKMQSIPGYDASPSNELFHKVAAEVGCAIIGQTADLAPADRRLYAVRDVTATVESIPLITASILSKKLAAGLHGLVMDVKFGNGAFMTEPEAAEELAQSIVHVARGAGLPTNALLTDMNQVLGRTAGNAVEVLETIDWLTNSFHDDRLDEVVYALCAEMLVLGGLDATLDAARQSLVDARESGAAAERFGQMVHALGGPSDLVEHPRRHLDVAAVQQPIAPERSGVVAAVDTRAVGLAVVGLGGGRVRVEDPVDHAVGLVEIAAIGEPVGPDRPLAVVHARTADQAERAAQAVRSAFAVADTAAPPGAVVRSRVSVD